MPAKLSKFVINATCKEYVHPWTDSCISSTAGLGLHAFQESFKIYSTLYLLTLLMKRRVPSKDDIKKTVHSIIQSTVFLSWSSFAYAMFLCSLRRLLGNFNILTVSFIPSFLSSLSAIILERPSRRTLLCLYVSNIATETLFRMVVWRGYVSPIPRAEVYIFAVSSAVLLYLFRSKANNKDSIFGIIRFILGRHEEVKYMKRQEVEPTITRSQIVSCKEHENNCNCGKKLNNTSTGSVGILQRLLDIYKIIIDKLKAQVRLSKHISCPHPYSCLRYILTGSVELFGYGLVLQLVLKSVFKVKHILKRPKLLNSIIFRRDTYNIALFLGGFAGLYKLLSCTLRRTFDNDSPYFAIPAGFIASMAFVMYPNNTIALSVMWKALHLLWNNGVENEKVLEVKWFVIFLYCFSTALLFHAAIIEPQNLRSSYWKFLCTLSGRRVASMSRAPLDEFGLNSSKFLQEVLRQTNTTDRNTYSF